MIHDVKYIKIHEYDSEKPEQPYNRILLDLWLKNHQKSFLSSARQNVSKHKCTK